MTDRSIPSAQRKHSPNGAAAVADDREGEVAADAQVWDRAWAAPVWAVLVWAEA